MNPKRTYKIRIDETIHEVDEKEITGKELLRLAGYDPKSHFITMIIKGQPDKIISDDETVDLSLPGRERFTVVAKEDEDRSFTIFVNGRKKVVKVDHLCFQDLLNIRFDNNPPQGENWVFTVAYRNGPRENPKGTLLKGECVKLKDGMKFDVTATDKS